MLLAVVCGRVMPGVDMADRSQLENTLASPLTSRGCSPFLLYLSTEAEAAAFSYKATIDPADIRGFAYHRASVRHGELLRSMLERRILAVWLLTPSKVLP
jgi:hypothetical protein